MLAKEPGIFPEVIETPEECGAGTQPAAPYPREALGADSPHMPSRAAAASSWSLVHGSAPASHGTLANTRLGHFSSTNTGVLSAHSSRAHPERSSSGQSAIGSLLSA